MSRIMIAGTGSGCGKTTIVCGLCQCFKDMGLKYSTPLLKEGALVSIAGVAILVMQLVINKRKKRK